MNPADLEKAHVVAHRLALEWDLTLGEPLPGATCSLVLEVGENLVLKVPFPHAEEGGAWQTVRAFSGHGGVELIRHESGSGAMLMPRLRPGTTLCEAGLDDLGAVDVCAGLISSLRSAPVVDGIPLTRWYRTFSGLPDSPLAREAERVYADLQCEMPPPTLLHGDLHHFNILRNGDEWAVIDPKGLVGDPSFEVVGFMRNPLNRTPDSAGMRARLERFAEKLGDPVERLWGWSFVETINCSSSPGGFDWGAAAEAIWDARP